LSPFAFARFVCDRELEEARVVGGEALSKKELSVDELLLPVLLVCDCGSSTPSLLELPDESRVVTSLLKEAFERRRSWKSLRKEGIAAAADKRDLGYDRAGDAMTFD